jgi:MmyB-like transcription regulator ligand binding domain
VPSGPFDGRADFEFHSVGVAEEQRPGVAEALYLADVGTCGCEPLAHVVEAGAGGDRDAVVVDGAAASWPGAVSGDRACCLLGDGLGVFRCLGSPNLTRFVFTDERARRVFPDWDQVADERAFHLSLGAPSQRSEQLIADLTALAGPEFTDRVRSGRLPQAGGPQAWCHPVAGGLPFDRELLEFPPAER